MFSTNWDSPPSVTRCVAAKRPWLYAALAKLAHCGIDPRSVDAEKLSAMLADKGCGGYSAEQWATMLKSVKALDAEEANAVYAKATSETPCASDDCPMTLVAKELAAGDKAPKNN